MPEEINPDDLDWENAVVVQPTGKPEPLGYEVAYEILFSNVREVERKLNEIIILVDEAKKQLKAAYIAAEDTRGPAFTRK